MAKLEVFSSWQHPALQCLREALLHEQQKIQSKKNPIKWEGMEMDEILHLSSWKKSTRFARSVIYEQKLFLVCISDGFQ